jgi:hypothetical protein
MQRVGAVHALGNAGVAASYALSWRARRKGHHARGVLLALAGGAGAMITGYLGGHLSYARAVGVGPRGLDDRTADRATTTEPAPTTDAGSTTDAGRGDPGAAPGAVGARHGRSRRRVASDT